MKKPGVRTLVVVALIAALIPALKLYAVQEILTILLVMAATAMVLLVAVAALLLFWEGLHLMLVWLSPAHDRSVADRSALSHGR